MSDVFDHESTRLRWAAIAAFSTHALAGLLMLFVLREGLASQPSIDLRMHFIATYSVRWRVGWLSWTAAAASILFFSFALARATRSRDAGRAAFSALAPVMAAAAVLADGSAQIIAIFVLPALAGDVDVDRFRFFEDMVTMLSGGIANALYTLATSILAWAARGWLPRYASIAAAVIAVSGAILTLAALVGSVGGMVVSNGALVPALLVWLWAVSSRAGRSAVGQ